MLRDTSSHPKRSPGLHGSAPLTCRSEESMRSRRTTRTLTSCRLRRLEDAQEQASPPGFHIEETRADSSFACSDSPLVITPEPSATGRSGMARGLSCGSDIAIACPDFCQSTASSSSSPTLIDSAPTPGHVNQSSSLARLSGISHVPASSSGKIGPCSAHGHSSQCAEASAANPNQHHRRALNPLHQLHTATAAATVKLARDCSDSDESEGVRNNRAGAAPYPACATPCEQAGPAYFNPLFDGGSEFPSPVTQPPSVTTRGPASASRYSHSPSPTRHVGSVPLGRRLQSRRHRHMHADGHRALDASTATAVLAALPLLYDLAPASRSPHGQSLTSMAALLGASNGSSPSSSRGRRQARHRLGRSVDPDRLLALAGDGSDEDFAGIDDGRLGATLDLMRRATALQRQLVSRIKEAAALRLQLEESDAAREEMGLQMLECQEYIISLERRLEQEIRSRSALVAQSQLLQEQLQETGEALHDAQTELQALQLQQAHQEGHPVPLEQVPGHVQNGSASGVTTCRTASASVCSGSGVASTTTIIVNSGLSSYGGYAASSSTASESGSGGEGAGTTGDDPRDLELIALRRENHALTQRLIKLSLDLAQTREKEEESRHEVQLLHDLNQGAMESINSLSLELSLLRPNACGRARGRFTLPFLWSSSGGGSNDKRPSDAGH